MTSEQRMLAIRLALGAIALCLTAPGCRHGDDLRYPGAQTAPYVVQGGDVVWAVAPLRNDSGAGVVDELALSDTLVNRIHEVEGVTSLPMNRTIGAMRALGFDSIDSPQDALALAKALGADAVLVGAVTAWDPYDPPELGLSLALFSRSEAMGAAEQAGSIDPLLMQRAVSDVGLEPGPAGPEPLSVASEHLDAANHGVQMAIRTYAEGRHETISSLGWRRYMASMPLFTEYACHEMVGRLLDAERLRLLRQPRIAEARD